MRKPFQLLLAVALTCLVTGVSSAADIKWGGEVFGALNTHSMSEFNDDFVEPLNAAGVSDFGSVKTKFGGGLNLRLWANQNWMLSAGWEPLFVKTDSQLNGPLGSGTVTGDMTLDFQANSFQVGAAYFLPSEKAGRYGFGAGVGYYRLGGEVSGTVNSTSPEFDSFSGTANLTGNTVGFHFAGMGEWTVSPGFAITSSAGYRIAKIDNAEITDATSTDTLPWKIDYSGFAGRVGLAFYLPSAN